jgi:hypothetical protein
VVFQLGEHLITDVVRALVELVKNAYDADASYAKISIMTDATPPEGSAFPDALGYIEIEDDGEGMSREAIRTGWLVISHSAKRAMKATGATTGRHARTPLGDKGLGRLGAQRLGENIEITTRSTPTATAGSEAHGLDRAKPGIHRAKAEENVVRFSWRDFARARRLSDVPVVLTANVPPTRTRGTRILISGLREPDVWRGDAARKNLQTSLSQLISPYQGVQGFRVLVAVNGSAVDLAQVSAAVRRTSQVRYLLAYNAGRLTVTGMTRLTFFRPPAGKLRQRFRDEVEVDEGAALLKYLRSQPEAASYHLEEHRADGWFVRFSQTFALEDLAGVVRLANAAAADPGPFRGEVDAFNLGAEAAREALDTVRIILGNETARAEAGDVTEAPTSRVFDTAAELNKFIKDLSGIRVYRDGFGVRVDYDWLGLASERTEGKSYYSLRPANTLGYVAISARDNANLVEKTDREGFLQSPHYENFRLLLSRFVEVSNGVHSFLRRGWVEFDRTFGVGPTSAVARATPAQVAKQIRDTMQSAETFRAPLRNVKHNKMGSSGICVGDFRRV